MKKFKWFTLLESLTVIVIIWIISTALYNMRNIWKDNTDLDKEAVNVIYKEINQSLKDFQRNKIWVDADNFEHEISVFQIISDWNDLEIWNAYVYCQTDTHNTTDCYNDSYKLNENVDSWTWYYDSKTLVNNHMYTASKHLRNIDQRKFYIWINDVSFTKYWEIISWQYITNFVNWIDNLINYSPTYNGSPITTSNKEICQWIMDECTRIVSSEDDSSNWPCDLCKEYPWLSRCAKCSNSTQWNDIDEAKAVRYNSCINHKTDGEFYDLCGKFIYDSYWDDEDPNATSEWNTKISFIIYNFKEKSGCNPWYLTPIWQIEINTVTKKANLKRCEKQNATTKCWSKECIING